MTFTGSLVALVTPFEDGVVDECRLVEMVRWQIANGSTGIVVLGSTGEASTLTHSERDLIIRTAAEAAMDRVPIVAGATSSSTSEAVEYAQAAAAAGADALLVASPYYNRPTPEGMHRHFECVANATDLPMILYNIPSRTAVNMPVDLVVRLANLPTVVAIKESSGDLDQATDLIAGTPTDFALIAGEDSLTLPLLALGATGVISVAANVAPHQCAELVDAFTEGDMERARRLHYQLLPLWRSLSLETNPGPLKAACQILGLCSDEVRLPLVSAGQATRRSIADALAGLDQPFTIEAQMWPTKSSIQ